MKKLVPFTYDETVGVRLYDEGDEPIGYVSLDTIDLRCEACIREFSDDCDYCKYDELADYNHYKVTSCKPFDGSVKKEFDTDWDHKHHITYEREFVNSTEAVKVFLMESQKLLD